MMPPVPYPMPLAHLDSSSHNSSSASLVPSVPYPTSFPSPVPSPISHINQAYELIPHRIFVGGFPSTTTENELRSFFEKYGHIRESKVIRATDGSPKGYGFVTFDTEEEAQGHPDKLEFKGRRLNLGPAMRRVTHSTRFTDFAVASPTPFVTCQSTPTLGGYHYQPTFTTGGVQSPAYVVLQQSGSVPSFVYSPVTPTSTTPTAQQIAQQLDAHYTVQTGQTYGQQNSHGFAVDGSNDTCDDMGVFSSSSSPPPSQQHGIYPQQQQQQQMYYPSTPITASPHQQQFRHYQPQVGK